jgi:hypothetical protein
MLHLPQGCAAHFRAAVDVAGEHHHVRSDLGQFHVPVLAVKIAQDTDANFLIDRTVYFFGLRFGLAERALAVATERRASSRSGLVCWIISCSQTAVIFAGTPA